MAGRDTWALFDLRNVHAVVDSNLTDRLLLMWCNGAGGGLSCLVGAIAYPVIQAGYVNRLIFNRLNCVYVWFFNCFLLSIYITRYCLRK